MSLFQSIATALGNLRANKLRTALTMLGMIIGVGAVIIMVSITEGARANVVSEFERLGSKMIFIVYQPSKEDQKETTRRIEGLKMADLRAIREQCSLVESVSPELPLPGQTAHYRDREMSNAQLVGIQPDYSRLRDMKAVKGRFLTDSDVTEWNKVCLIGDKVRDQLFNGEDPLGKAVDVQGVSLTVVGLLEKKGRGMDGDSDLNILLPISTLQKRILGAETVGAIFAQPKDSRMLIPCMDQIWQCLMRLHENLPGLRVDSSENILNAIGRILTIFGLVVGSIAGLALLVGGIGIMNIMLVSVTERTREIGIRKAVGARRFDILVQFLIESATVSGLGGLVGIGFGAGVAYSISAITRQFMQGGMGPGQKGIPAHLPLWAVLGAFAFSAFVGVFFGIYPAIRASRLQPVEALRHE